MRLGKDLVPIDSKKWPRGWPPSYWAALFLFLGLLVCLGGIAIVLVTPLDPEEIETQVLPKPEAPYISPIESGVEVSDMLDRVWASTVWVGREVRPGVTQYVGTGWVIGHTNKSSKQQLSYIFTCSHVATYHPELPLRVGYLGKSFHWSETPAWEVMRYDKRSHGDSAILAVERNLQSIKFANKQTTFAVNDEVFVAGVQWTAPPAIITVGVVSVIDRVYHEFQVKGWSWHGFSGGPVILRKTGDVIGFVGWGVKGHFYDASRSDCGDLTHFMALLKDCGLEHVIQE